MSRFVQSEVCCCGVQVGSKASAADDAAEAAKDSGADGALAVIQPGDLVMFQQQHGLFPAALRI
jgi:hypothetical protein